MKKKGKIFIVLAAVCLIIVGIFLCSTMIKRGPVNKFKNYLKEHEFSSSGDTYSMQSEMKDEFVTETYTETYNLKAHTLTARFTRYDRTDEITTEMEYIYNYAENTVRVNQYDRTKSKIDVSPDAIYFLNQEEMFECISGEESPEETEIYNHMFELKEVLEKHLEQAGVTLQEIIR